MYGVRNFSSLPIISKTIKTKNFVCFKFFPGVLRAWRSQLPKAALKVSPIVCTILKITFNTYTSFHCSVTEDDFLLIHNNGVWPEGCLVAPFLDTPDQIFNSDSHYTSRHPSPGAASSLAAPTSGLVPLIEEADGEWSYITSLKINCCDAKMRDISTSNIKLKLLLKYFTKILEFLRSNKLNCLIMHILWIIRPFV